MKLVPSKTPWLFKKIFPNYVWEFSNKAKNEKVIYLTFDDGPTSNITPWILDVLKQYNAKATFFCVGDNVKKHPEILNKILIEGHVVGNHTNTHIKGWYTNTSEYVSNFKKAEKILNAHVLNLKLEDSKNINLFRPPYGQLKRGQGNAIIKLNYKVIMWSVISFDWQQSISPIRCFNNVIKNTNNGSIVVFHDNVKALKNMQYTLPKVLEYYSKKGFCFKAITSSNFNH